MNAHGKSMPPQRSSSIRNPSDRFFFIRGLRERKTSEHFLLMTQRKSANPTQSKKPKTPPPRNRAPAARATDATDGSDKPVYRLRDLVKRYGVATLDEVLLYVGIEKAEFIATGRLISTSRVSKDTARIFGQAADFYDGATEDQLDALAGINPDLLRVAIWAAAENERLAELHAQSRTAGTQRRSTFEVAYAELRDKAWGGASRLVNSCSHCRVTTRSGARPSTMPMACLAARANSAIRSRPCPAWAVATSPMRRRSWHSAASVHACARNSSPTSRPWPCRCSSRASRHRPWPICPM